MLEFFSPPNGAFIAIPLVGWLTFTRPVFDSRAKSSARPRSRVTMPADRPNSVSLATSIASSNEGTRWNASTGPNTSSCASRIAGVTSGEHRRAHEVPAGEPTVGDRPAAACQPGALLLPSAT